MTKLHLFIGNTNGYETVFCDQENLPTTVTEVGARLKLEQNHIQELIKKILECDMALGISIRENDLTVHCSYSTIYSEAAVKRLGKPLLR